MQHRRYDMLSLGALLVLMAFECVLFFTHVAQQIAPFYPSNYDQVSYFADTFALLERFQM